MALVTDVGLSTSTSYVSMQEAEIYFEDRLHGTANWEAIDEQEAALITMTRLLDSYVNNFLGVRTNDDQALKWPRTGVVTPDGIEVADNIIPTPVKHAVLELVLSSYNKDRTSDSSLAGLSQVTAGPLTIKSDGGGYESTAPKVIPDHVMQLLSELTSSGGIGVVRLVRA